MNTAHTHVEPRPQLEQALGDEALLGLHEAFPDRYPVLLESVASAANFGRYDVLFALPGERLEQGSDGEIVHEDGSRGGGRFLGSLDDWWQRERGGGAPGTVPFQSGWFLYLGYEVAAEIEPSLVLPQPRHLRALAWRMRGIIVRERATGKVSLQAEGGSTPAFKEQLSRDFSAVAAGSKPHSSAPMEGSCLTGAIDEQDPAVFRDGVRAILAAIGRGDVYQANLSRPWRGRVVPGVTETRLYRRLRAANPAPFSAIARLPGFSILSSSPERLLRIERGVASTRPIAGTRPRGHDADSDLKLRRELRLNEKERAEHVMLVDLERNDLGRICRAGTVRVDELMTIESYAHVHHIVSNVRGELDPGVTPGQAIRAVFPGGTITGCPKVRCMQLLAELEKEPRDAYTGSIGYLGLDGSLDLNILIRTLTVEGDRVEFRTGGGIVADSEAEAELAETRAKARGLLRALGSDG
jgi:anthranilate synthase component 1